MPRGRIPERSEENWGAAGASDSCCTEGSGGGGSVVGPAEGGGGCTEGRGGGSGRNEAGRIPRSTSLSGGFEPSTYGFSSFINLLLETLISISI